MSGEKVFHQRMEKAQQLRADFYSRLDESLEKAVIAFNSREHPSIIVEVDPETRPKIANALPISKHIFRSLTYSEVLAMANIGFQASRDSFITKYSSYFKQFFGQDANEHVQRIGNMVEYCLEDMIRIAEIEATLSSGYGKFYDGNTTNLDDDLAKSCLIPEIRYPVETMDVDKRTHNFIAQLSTLIDNVYKMVADYYEIEQQKGRDFKIEIQNKLRERGDYRLASTLKEKFAYSADLKGLPLMRNEILHNIPTFHVEAILKEPVGKTMTGETVFEFIKFSPTITYGNGTEVRENLYDFMEKLYSHILKTTTEVIGYIAADIVRKQEAMKAT